MVSLRFTLPARRTEWKWWSSCLNMEHLSRLSLRYYTTGPHLLFSAWLYSLAFGTRLGFFKLRRLWTVLSCSVSYIAVICLLMLLVSVWIYGNDLICFSTVWPDTHPCGSLHGPWEHCPCSDAPWSITQHDQRSEWKFSNALLDVRSTRFFFFFQIPHQCMWKAPRDDCFFVSSSEVRQLSIWQPGQARQT